MHRRLAIAACLCLGSLQVCADEIDAKGWMERGRLYESEQRLSLALSCFGKAIKADPDCEQAYLARIDLLVRLRQDYAAAVADLTEYLRLRPTDYSGLFDRGMYRTQLKDFDGAIADYTQALDPKSDFSRFKGLVNEARARAFHYRGQLYHQQTQDAQRAIADYSESIKLDPSVARLYYLRAVAYQELKQYEAANGDFKEAIKRESSFPDLRNAYAWHLATCPIKKFRSGKQALIMAKDPATIAAAFAEMGQFSKAIESQEVAIANLKLRKSTGTKIDETQLHKLKENLNQLKAQQPIRD